MKAAIEGFSKAMLRSTTTVKKSVADVLGGAAPAPPPESTWVRTADGWREVAVEDGGGGQAAGTASMRGAPHELHGQCYSFEKERNAWAPPTCTYASDQAARPGYDAADASEYVDDDAVLDAKVRRLAALVRASRCFVVYAGAGLSTSAGIDDYATRSGGGERGFSLRSPLCAQPTLAHRVLAGLHAAGHLHRLVQQNHDGLPQKAGMPQQALNEIHVSLYAPDNPVIPMSGNLRADLLDDLLELEATADLCLAVGTSLAGMNADRVVHAAAHRAAERGAAGGALGAVIVGLQRTTADANATLRIFAPCDEVFRRLADELPLGERVPPPPSPGTFFRPALLGEGGGGEGGGGEGGSGEGGGGECGEAEDDARYLLQGVAYDAMGRRSAGATTDLDLRDGARLLIPSGMHAGASGEVDGYDREGHPRCRFRLKLKKDGAFKAPMAMPLGTWWLQAAADGAVARLPVVNLPRDGDESAAAAELRALSEAYAG